MSAKSHKLTSSRPVSAHHSPHVNAAILNAPSLDTRLASRTAFLEARVTALQTNNSFSPIEGGTAAAQDTGGSSSQALTPSGGGTGSGVFDITHPTLIQLKADLAEAQRTRATLTTELADLKVQHAQAISAHSDCASSISQLTFERDQARGKLATREEEMMYKHKQVERLHDDIIVLEMQLNILHDQHAALQKEYNLLVTRMVQYKEKEAEDLINNSRYS